MIFTFSSLLHWHRKLLHGDTYYIHLIWCFYTARNDVHIMVYIMKTILIIAMSVITIFPKFSGQSRFLIGYASDLAIYLISSLKDNVRNQWEPCCNLTFFIAPKGTTKISPKVTTNISPKLHQRAPPTKISLKGTKISPNLWCSPNLFVFV